MTVTEPTDQRTEHTAPAHSGSDVEDTAVEPDGLVAEELLVEEISIDGMCGVY